MIKKRKSIRPKLLQLPSKKRLPRLPKAKKDYVYTIYWSGLAKIGRTTNPKNRLKAYALSNPFIEHYSHLVEVPFGESEKIEAALHQRYMRYRYRGEWFKADEAVRRQLTEDFDRIEKRQRLDTNKKLLLD